MTDKELSTFTQLHPAVQVAIIVCAAATICVWLWQLFKTLRE